MELTHVIIFHDRSKKLITALDYEEYRIGRKNFAKGIVINGCDYLFSAMAKVLSVAEFYAQYPAERPNNITEIKIPSLDNILEDASKHDHKKALKGIIIGLKRYIASTEDNPIVNNTGLKSWYQGTEAPLELLAKMENKLALIGK